MSFERRDIVGGAVATTLSSGIDSSVLSFAIAVATGWPTGANGDFFVVIDRGTANEEKLRCASRSSLTVTVQTAGRGSDGTSGVAHVSGAAVEHCITAVDADEANYTVNETVGKVTAAGDLLVGDGTASLDNLAIGTTGYPLVAGASTPAYTQLGTSGIADDAITSAKIATDAVGSAEIAADAVGTSEIAADAVTSSEIATDAVGTAEIAALAVGAAELAADSVTTAKILDANVTLAKLAADSVDSSKIVAGTIVASDIADTTITAAKLEAALPLGHIAGASVTANQATITTIVDLTSLTLSIDQVSGRHYRYTVNLKIQSNTASDYFGLTLADGANTVINQWLGVTLVAANNDLSYTYNFEETAGSTATVTRKLRLARAGASAGTFQMSAAATAPAFIVCEDIGT